MSIQAWRAASRLVGRRTALRLLAVGVGGSVLAACKSSTSHSGGKGKKTSKTKWGSHHTHTSSPSPASGVTGRAFASFVRGTWKVTTQAPHESPFSYTMTIADGTWALNGHGGSEKGTWTLQGGRLQIGVPKDMGGTAGPTAAAENVPARVADSVSLSLPWQPPGESGTASGQRLDVQYTRQSGLRIRHFDAGGSMTVHHAVRA
ncbi:hypothetical protein ACWCV9_34025 [Streptomyces sp. NPDC001606]